MCCSEQVGDGTLQGPCLIYCLDGSVSCSTVASVYSGFRSSIGCRNYVAYQQSLEGKGEDWNCHVSMSSKGYSFFVGKNCLLLLKLWRLNQWLSPSWLVRWTKWALCALSCSCLTGFTTSDICCPRSTLIVPAQLETLSSTRHLVLQCAQNNVIDCLIGME